MTKDSKICIIGIKHLHRPKTKRFKKLSMQKVGAVEGAINAQAVYNNNTATINCIQGDNFALTVIPITNVSHNQCQ